jgi:hypothetical protein
VIDRLRPYWLHAYLLVYTPLLLYLDGLWRAFWPQCGLGVLTFFVLWCCTRYLPPGHRRQVWVCVVIATGFEVFGSLIWGVYRYRLGNIPLYVPPGHGLVYVFGLLAADLPVFRRHGRRAATAILLACAVYQVAGLTVLPLVTHRLDVQGAFCLPVLAWCVRFSPRYALFAAIFVATLDLELAGTWAGDWTWAARAPWTGLPSGNPPAAIAGGYCVIDGTVLLVMAVLVRLPVRWRRPPPSQPAGDAVPAHALAAETAAVPPTPALPRQGGGREEA